MCKIKKEVKTSSKPFIMIFNTPSACGGGINFTGSRWHNKILFIMILLFINSCITATTPTIEDLNSADYGQYPSNYLEIIGSYLDKSLVAPGSLRGLEISSPDKYWFKRYRSDLPQYAYKCCVVFNSKNSTGGYTGKQAYFVAIKNNNIIYFERMGSGEFSIIPYPEECYQLYKKCIGPD